MSFKRTGISLGLGLLVLVIGFTFYKNKSVDDGELEKQVTEQITATKGFADSDVSVKCPPSEELKKGTNFDCTATIDGQEVAVPIELVDDDGNYRSQPPSSPAALKRGSAVGAN